MPLKRSLRSWLKTTAQRFGWEIRRSDRTIGALQPFLKLLRKNGLRPSVILDVGANKAHWSRVAQEVFPEAQFILIEPQVEMEPYLDAFCNESHGSTWKLAGVGPAEAEMTLNIWPDLAGSSLFEPSDSTAPLEQRRVPIVTIDSLFADGTMLPQLVKLDIQGFELEALKGATKLFGATECFILEVSLFHAIPDKPRFIDVVNFMDQRGYKVYDVPGYLRRPLDDALGQVDLAFARVGGILDRDQRWRK